MWRRESAVLSFWAPLVCICLTSTVTKAANPWHLSAAPPINAVFLDIDNDGTTVKIHDGVDFPPTADFSALALYPMVASNVCNCDETSSDRQARYATFNPTGSESTYQYLPCVSGS